MSKARRTGNADVSSSAQRLGKKIRSKPAKRPDRRLRGVSDALDHLDRRNLRDAFDYGLSIRRAPTTTIDFHPIHMRKYPEGELAVWFRDELRNRIATWLRRRKIGWYALWTRENYVGDQREHLHLMVYCPTRLRAGLEDAIRRWFPGEREMIRIGVADWRKHPSSGRLASRALEYRLKQMTSTAQGPPRPGRPRREIKSRHDDAPVAPVNGLRCGMSRSLDKKARATWAAERDALYTAGRDAQQILPEMDELIPTPATAAADP